MNDPDRRPLDRDASASTGRVSAFPRAGTDTDMEPLPEPSSVDAAAACAAAADSAARCARVCLADPRIYDLEDCIEWCVLGSQVLGTCAQALQRRPLGARAAVVDATVDAAILAAEGCLEVAAAAPVSIDELHELADRCTTARDALRQCRRPIDRPDEQATGGQRFAATA